MSRFVAIVKRRFEIEVKHRLCLRGRSWTHYTLDIGNVPHCSMYPEHSDHKARGKMESHTLEGSVPPATLISTSNTTVGMGRRTCSPGFRTDDTPPILLLFNRCYLLGRMMLSGGRDIALEWLGG
jgi:hypothetical protein